MREKADQEKKKAAETAAAAEQAAAEKAAAEKAAAEKAAVEEKRAKEKAHEEELSRARKKKIYRSRYDSVPSIDSKPFLVTQFSQTGSIPIALDHNFAPMELHREAHSKLSINIDKTYIIQQLNTFSAMVRNRLQAKGISTNMTIEPTPTEIDDKVKKELSYYSRSVDLTAPELDDYIKFLKIHIEKIYKRKLKQQSNKTQPEPIVCCIDLENLTNSIIERFGTRDNYSDTMNEVFFFLVYHIKTHNITDIILTLQNHRFSDSDLPRKAIFFAFIEDLINLLGRNNVLLMPAHNRSLMDDFFLILCCIILLSYYLITILMTSDNLNEFKNISDLTYSLINPIMDYNTIFRDKRPSTFIIENPETYPIHLPNFSGFVKDLRHDLTGRGSSSSSMGHSSRGHSSRGHSSRGHSSRGHSSRGHNGGTIKYKKSLLNKRTRKIYKKNYSKKMKKYSKNKKKKTVTRRRL
jgi:hypothetical protein